MSLDENLTRMAEERILEQIRESTHKRPVPDEVLQEAKKESIGEDIYTFAAWANLVFALVHIGVETKEINFLRFAQTLKCVTSVAVPEKLLRQLGGK